LQDAIMHGAVKRVRPKFMTVACMFMGLVPIMWSTGTGADVMKRIAAPMIGGIFTSFILELLVYPAIYEVWKWNFSSSGPFDLTIVTFERARLDYGDRKQFNFSIEGSFERRQIQRTLAQDQSTEQENPNTMKTVIVFFGAAALLVSAQAKRTFTGIVTDKMCGADHTAMNVKPDARCVRECVKAGSQYALVEGGNVYLLGSAKAADAFAGQKVRVSGTLDTKTNIILVDAITAAEPRP
jgi:hypothetical protein